MNKAYKKAVFHTTEVVVLIVLTCIVSIVMGFFVGKKVDTSLSSNLEYDASVEEFLSEYQYIIDNYYGEIDSKTLMNGALNGMIEALGDEYSTIISEESFDTKLDGNYDGVGIEIYKATDGNIYVLNVFANSPAEEAGMQVGDIIISVDGNSFVDKDVSYLTDYILNSDSTSFEFTIMRDGASLILHLKKGSVVISSVDSDLFERNGKKIGYIYIDIFANATATQFSDALTELESQKIDGLIIDVRGNSGGHLTTVVDILSNFLDSKKVIYQTESKTETKKFYSVGSETKIYPIAVLQDGNSASASELLSISLKEQYGAIIIGETSYGKGTVQEVVTSGNTEYKFTTKKWLSPNGNWINEIGVIPDVNVTLSSSYYTNPTYENDNQLQTAINELSK